MIRALGPDGVRARMAEIQARMDALNPPVEEDRVTFYDTLNRAQNGQLSGPIGNDAAGGFTPVHPGQGSTVVMPARSRLHAMIETTAASQGLPPALLDALVAAESSYDPGAVSGAGAKGLTQLMPKTAAGLGVTDPFDPEQNLLGGARYLKQLIGQYGDVRTALAAYNAGPNNIGDSASDWPSSTVRYVNKVMGLYSARRSG